MEEAKTAAVLSVWKTPVSLRIRPREGYRRRIAIVPSLGSSEITLAFLEEPDRDAEPIAALLVEAFNAHFGTRLMSDEAAVAFRVSDVLRGRPAEVGETVDLNGIVEEVRQLKRESEELRARTMFYPGWQNFVRRMLDLGGITEERLKAAPDPTGEELLGRVLQWKKDSEELAEIKAGPVLHWKSDPAIDPGEPGSPPQDDPARQDCNRAARSLGKILGWTEDTTRHAGALIFSEICNGPAPESNTDDRHRCAAFNEAEARCILPANHRGPHFRHGHFPWTVRP